MGMSGYQFRVVAENAQGTVYSNAAVLTVTAPPPPTTYVVTIAGGGAGAFVAGGVNHVPGSTVMINAGTRAGFGFGGWTFSPVVSLAGGSAATAASVSFIMPAANVTATANWTAIGWPGPADEQERDRYVEGPPLTWTGGAPGPRPTPQPTEAEPEQDVPAPPEPEYEPMPPWLAPAWGFSRFDDVLPGSWYYDYVETVAVNGLFQGTGHRIFDPYVSMTRAMFVQVLARLYGADLGAFAENAPAFYDVEPGAWYFAAVEWAAQMGIVLGFGEGMFAPQMEITREQMAAMLYRYVQFMGIQLPVGEVAAFIDQDAISDWAREAVEAIQAAGIVAGRPDGSFDPQATATRAEVAAIFARFLELI
jgi:hypothetical protein